MSKTTRRAVPILILTMLALSMVSIAVPVMALTKPTLENQKTPYVGQAKGDYDDTVTVTGVDGEIPAGTEVELYWDSLVAWDGEKGLLNTTDAESDGNYEIWFDVPSAVAGDHYLWVKSISLDEQASSKFVVVPRIKLSSDSGLTGDRVDVKGYGFGDEKNVAILFHNLTFANIPVSSKTAEVLDKGDGTETDFDGTVDKTPIKPGTFTVTVDGTVFTDNSYGKLTATGITGSIDYISGEWELKFTTAPTYAITFTASYDYFVDAGTAGVDYVDLLTEAPDTTDLGYFERRITIPSKIAEMTYTITAYDDKGNMDGNSYKIGPTISLDPDEGPVGEKVRIRGRGFTKSGTIAKTGVTMYKGTWGPVTCGIESLTDTTVSIDSAGEFRLDIMIPQTKKTGDDFVIKVTDNMAQSSTEEYEVLGRAEIEVTPDFGQQGAEVNIKGWNFTQIADEDVTVTLGGVDVGIEPETNSAGYFEADFTIPAVGSGLKEMKAEIADYNINATQDFKVGLMVVILSPDDGECGELITMTGSGFTKNKEWNMTIGDMVLYEDEIVGSVGNITEAFYMPSMDAGTYTVSVYDRDSDIKVTAEFEVTDKTYIELDPASGPNRGPKKPKNNITIEGEFFMHKKGEAVDLVLYNATDDWEMEVLQGSGKAGKKPKTPVVTDKDGYFEAWWELLDNETLGLGDYTVNATQEGPDDEELIAQFEFSIIVESMSISPRKVAYAIGDTVAFNIESSWKETGSYIEIYDPGGTLYWKTDDLDTWEKVAGMRVAPYYSQTAGGNPMELASDAPLGTWSWEYYDLDDKLFDEGTFTVSAAPEEILAERMDELSGDLSDVKSDIESVTSDIAGVKSDVAGAKTAADAAKAAADSAKDAISDVADTADSAAAAAESAASAAADAKTAAEDAGKAASGLTTLVYGAIGASLVAALAAIVSLMQISRRIAG